MKSVILLAFISAVVAQIYPVNYTTLVSNEIYNGNLYPQPTDSGDDFDYEPAYIASGLYVYDVPVNAQALALSFTQTDNVCSGGLYLTASNTLFSCTSDDDTAYGLNYDVCDFANLNTEFYSSSSDSEPNFVYLNAADNEYVGGEDAYTDFVFTPGTRIFFSVMRETSGDYAGNCTFSLNVTVIAGCNPNNSMPVAIEDIGEDEGVYEIQNQDIPCFPLYDLGTVNSTNSFVYYNMNTKGNYTATVFRVTLPENVAYINASLKTIGSDYIQIYGGSAPSIDSQISATNEDCTTTSGNECDYTTTVTTAFFTDPRPKAGAYYVVVYSDNEFYDYPLGYTFNISINVLICDSAHAGDLCQYSLQPLNLINVFTGGQTIYVPDGGAAYVYFDISPAYALVSFNLYAFYQTVGTNDDNDAYIYLRKDQFPLYDDDVYSDVYSSYDFSDGFDNEPVFSFSQYDFLGNSGRYYMAVFCNPDSSSGNYNCNTTFYANLTNVGQNNIGLTGFLTGGSSTNSTGASSASTAATGTSASTKSTASSGTSASTASTAATSKSSSTGSKSTAGSSTGSSPVSTTGAASSVVPCIFALVAIIAMMF